MALLKSPSDVGADKSRRLEIIIFLVLVAGYCAVQFHNLLLPGIMTEEAYEAGLAQQGLRLGISNMLYQSNFYHAILQDYLLLPFLLAIKRPEVAVRVGEICFSLAVIATAYLCARRFFNRTVALFSLILLLTNPLFIYMSRISLFHGGIMAAFYVGALLCLKAWSQTERDRHLFCAAFLVGAGTCVRLWFLWFPAGMLLALPLYRHEAVRLIRRPPAFKRLAWAACCFALGSSLFIIKEIRFWGTDMEILHYMVRHFPVTDGFFNANGGSDNLAVMRNLAQILHQFAAALAGQMWGMQLPESLMRPSLRNPMEVAYGALLVLSMLCVLILAKDDFLRKGRFFIGLLAGMFLCSLYTTSAYIQAHLYILFPLPQIVMGLAAFLLFQRARTGQSFRKRAPAFLGLLLYAIAPTFHLWELSKMERFVRWTGGTGRYSDSSKALSNWLEEQGDFTPNLCDYQIVHTLRFFSDGRVNPTILRQQPDWGLLDPKREPLSCCISDRNPYVFIADRDDSTNRDCLAFLSALVKAKGRRLVEAKVFLTRNGERNFSVYRLK